MQSRCVLLLLVLWRLQARKKRVKRRCGSGRRQQQRVRMDVLLNLKLSFDRKKVGLAPCSFSLAFSLPA